MLWGGALALALAVALTPASATAATGRAWELVTPPDPNGTATNGVVAVTPDGDRVAYISAGPLPGAPAGSQSSANLATRGPHGWESVPLGHPYSMPTGGQVSPTALVASDDALSSWIVSSTRPLLPGAPAAPDTGLYRREVGGPPALLAGGQSVEVYGGAADLRTVVFQTMTPLLPADVRSSGRQVYESTAGGELRLAGVDGAGVPLSACGVVAGAGNYQPNTVSRDGRRIFLSSPDASGCGGTKRVYLRENASVTTEISASRCTRIDCNAPQAVSFMGATPSGAVAYLATAQQLTNDDVDSGRDLYRYDVARDDLTRVSVGPSGSGAAVLGSAVYPSSDGARVYFIASGTLVSGQPLGGPAIFLADDEGIHYVGALASGEAWLAVLQLSGAGEIAQVTPDGARLLFGTTRALTLDDTDDQVDAYLYDADEDSLTRVSGSGASGNGAFDVSFAQVSSGLEAVRAPIGRPRRSLTDDGRQAYFSTQESLVAGDVNGTTDVYQWDDGELQLITSGQASGSVTYRTASADGRSVFFTTDESLVPEDDDGGDPDLYVARAGGGFQDAGGGPDAGCQGASCTRPVTRVSRPVPASVGFTESSAGQRRFGALPVPPDARRRMAASGVLRLTVATPRRGRVDARALARLGRGTRIVAKGHVVARRAGKVRLRLRLSRPAVRWLRDGHVLRLRVVLSRSRPERTSVLRLRLDPPR